MNPRYQPRQDYNPKHSDHPNPARDTLDQQTREYLSQGGKITEYGVTYNGAEYSLHGKSIAHSARNRT